MDDAGPWMGTGKGLKQPVAAVVECHATEAESVSPALNRRVQALIEALSPLELKNGEADWVGSRAPGFEPKIPYLVPGARSFFSPGKYSQG